MVRGIPDFPFRLKVLFFVGGKGKLFIKKQILACFQQRSSSQIQPHLRKCTVAGAGKGRVKILLSVDCPVIALNGMIFFCNTSLTDIGISVKASVFSEIIKGRYHLEGRSRRVLSLGGSI